MPRTAPVPFAATVLGYPRIGPRRELKSAVEAYWAGRSSRAELLAAADARRRQDRDSLVAAGLDSVPVNTFSLYDQVLDAATLVGVVPARYRAIADPLDRYFAMARGNADLAPLEMTKWFDTNYHYLVPEIDADTDFTLDADPVLAEVAEALAAGVPARPVLIGPVTLLLLAKSTDGSDPLDRLDELLPLYGDLLRQLADAGVGWVQLDEPSSSRTARPPNSTLSAAPTGPLPRPMIGRRCWSATYFGDAREATPVLVDAGVDGVAVDLVRGGLPDGDLSGVHVLAGVVNGRNVWRTDPDRALHRSPTCRDAPERWRCRPPARCCTSPTPLTTRPGLDPRSAVLAGVRPGEGGRGGRARARCCRRRRPGTRRHPRALAGRQAPAGSAAPRYAPPSTQSARKRCAAPTRPCAARCSKTGWRCRSADHDDRVVPADRRGAQGPRRLLAGRIAAASTRSGCGRDRRGHRRTGGRSAWTCWCTASRNATTWCSTSPSNSTGSRPPPTPGSSPTDPGVCGRRSCTETCPARTR